MSAGHIVHSKSIPLGIIIGKLPPAGARGGAADGDDIYLGPGLLQLSQMIIVIVGADEPEILQVGKVL